MRTENWTEAVKQNASRVVLRMNYLLPHGLAWLLLDVMLLAPAVTSYAGRIDIGGKRSVDVMTVNLYVGGDPGRVVALDPTDPSYFSNLVVAVTGVYYEILFSRPDVRLAEVADRIVARKPVLVAVQEASLIRVESPGDLVVGGTTPATDIVADYLEILMGELNARGAHYAVATDVEELDVEMPAKNLETGGFDDVRLTDRDAILVRTDLPPGQFRVTHPQGGNFNTALQFPAVGISVLRGWCSVDVFVRGGNFRFICSHVEEETSPDIQMNQVRELLCGPARTQLPVIIAGDFNADPLHRTGVTRSYDMFTAAGFKDAWATAHPRNPAGGLTWGHDEFLADPSTKFIWRLDLVMYRGGNFVPKSADVLDMVLNRAEPPLWASDHTAVSVEFSLQGAPSGRATRDRGSLGN